MSNGFIEFTELLPVLSTDFSSSKGHGDRSQTWILGTREQVLRTINGFYVKRIATDRVKFTPIGPGPFATGQ